jgi:hypothetical protein
LLGPRLRPAASAFALSGFGGQAGAAPRHRFGQRPGTTKHPHSLVGPGQAAFRSSFLRRPLKRGRAERRGSNNPAASCEKVERSHEHSHHEDAGSPALRARCLRLAPLRPRWTYRFRRPSLRKPAYPPLRTQIVPSTSDRAGCHRQWGPATHGWCAGTKRLGPPFGCLRRISNAPKGHRSPPRV